MDNDKGLSSHSQTDVDTSPIGTTSSVPPVAAFQGSLIRNQIGHIDRCHGIPRNKTSVAQWRYYLVHDWDNPAIWRSAFVESMATASLCFTSGLIDTTIGNFKINETAAFVGVTNIVLLSLFIMAAAPGSGGHLNQLITFSTMLTGLTGFSRGILYILGQTLGAALAGGVLRGAFGAERAKEWKGGGCFRDPGTIAAGQALIIETFSCFTLLFLAYGVALDPRQGKLFGPLVGPLAVGLSLGLTSFASAGLVPGYTGAQMMPARCFAFGIVRNEFHSQWIWWVGPALAAILQALTYAVVPVYQRTKHTARSRSPS